MTTQYLLQLVISGLVVGSIYSAVALGLVIIYKATRVVNFAQGELLMVGA
ncbi:MAG TPA: branched-chain amino acid ABC transporter permease, partial [Thermoanaerobaculia bacterium]|nr:branched-chain amino acid ABC transporter permease [Thermoanaerobaculia bacterium]